MPFERCNLKPSNEEAVYYSTSPSQLHPTLQAPLLNKTLSPGSIISTLAACTIAFITQFIKNYILLDEHDLGEIILILANLPKSIKSEPRG